MQQESAAKGYLLNGLMDEGKPYKPKIPRTREDDEALVWNAKLFVSTKRTHCSADRFEQIFAKTMNYITTTEHHMYMDIQRGNTSMKEFVSWLRIYFQRNYPEMANENDYSIMLERLKVAIFQYYVLQPLIDHPDTSDIKICAPDDIRVRVKGKAYRSSSTFLNDVDLFQFVEGLALRNGLDFSNPVITFTDTHDKHYILRFLISAPVVNAVPYPYLHIRKVPRDKPDFKKLIEDDMLNEMVMEYLKDRIKVSRGIGFFGPPGCVDRETEYFNGHEWKSIADYQDDEQVLQFDAATGEASLVMPERYIKEPCSKMYRFETPDGLVQMLSPEHRMLYYECGTGVHPPCVSTAEAVHKWYQKKKHLLRNRYIRTSFTVTGHTGDGITLTDEELMTCIRGQMCNPKMHLNWSYWYQCNNRQLRLIRQTVFRSTTVRWTENKAFADFLQFACTVSGFRAVVSGDEQRGYTVSVYSDTMLRLSDATVTEEAPEDGYKYCFTVPSSFLVLRRNNKIFVTGNSGKSTLLNAGLEVIPKTRETLVIQENDELHTKQSGFMFKHVTHGFHGEPVVTLEDLGKMALVEGCNEFVIGEVKGGEMRYAATLMNTGGYCMYTAHSLSAKEALPHCADLIKQGSDYSFEDACKMLSNVGTVVYMECYQVQEILENLGYDPEIKDFRYRLIYKNLHPRGAQCATLDEVEGENEEEGGREEAIRTVGMTSAGAARNAARKEEGMEEERETSPIPDFAAIAAYMDS